MGVPILEPEVSPEKVISGVAAIEGQAKKLVVEVGKMSKAFDDFGDGIAKKSRPGLEALKQAVVSNVSEIAKQLEYLTTANDRLARDLARSQSQVVETYKSTAKKVQDTTRSHHTVMDSLMNNIEDRAKKNASLMLGADTIGVHTKQVQAVVKGHYDALGVFQDAAVVKAKVTNPLMLGADTIGVHAKQVQAVVKGHYDALGVFQDGAVARAQAANARLLGAGAGSVGTPSTSRATPVGSYNALGVYEAPVVRELVVATKELGAAHMGGAGKASQARKANSELNATMRDGHSAARGLASGFGAMWLTWGSIAPLLAGAAVSHAFVQMVKSGAEVQHTLAQIRVVAGESAESVARLNEQMLELARSGPFGPKEVATAFKTMALAGLSAESVSTAIRDVLNFSLAGDIGIKEAADVLTSVGTAFRIGADGYGYISDVISKAAAESKSSVEDFSGAMKTASVVNIQYGVSLEDTAIGISLLANSGIRGTAAGTSLRNMYADLSGRTKDTKKAMMELGVQALDPLTGKMRGTKDVFVDLIKALGDKAPTEASDYIKRIFSERGSKDAMAIMSALRTQAAQTGVDAGTMYDQLAEKIANASGFAAIAAAEMTLTPLNQMKSVSAALQATLVESFDAMQPYILQIASDLKELFNSDNFKSGLQSLAIGMGNIIKFVVEWSSEIVSVILVYKGFTSVLSVMAAVAAGTAAIGAAATASGVAFTGMSLAMRLATLANPILLGITAVVTGLAAAWAFLKVNQDSATGKPVSETNLPELNKALEAELKHINNVNQARREKISLMELEARQNATLAGATVKSKLDVLRDQREQAAQVLRNAGERPSGAPTSEDPRRSSRRYAFDLLVAEFKQADDALRTASTKYLEDVAYNADLLSQLKAGHAEAAAVAKSQPVNVLGSLGATPSATSDDTKAAAKAATQDFKESTTALASEIKLLKLEQDNADKAFANTDAINKRNAVVRGFATELETATKHTAELAKADSQYIIDLRTAAAAAVKIVNDPKSTAQASQQAKEDLAVAVEALGVKKLTAVEAASIAKTDADRVAVAKIALDIASHAKAARDLEYTAQKDSLSLAQQQNALALIGVNLTAAQKSELDRLSAVEIAELDYKLASKEAEVVLETELARLRKLQEDGSVTDIGYSAQQAGLKYLEAFRSAAQKRNTALASADVKAATTTKNEFQKVFDATGNVLADALVTGGSEGAKKVGDYLRDELLRKPFRMIIQAVLDPITGLISGAIQDTQGAAGSANALGTASTLMSLTANVGKMADAFNGAGLADFAKSGMGQSLGLSKAANVPGIAESGSTLTTAGNAFAGMPLGGVLTAYSVGGVSGFAAGVASTAVAGAVAAGAASLAAGGTAMAAGSAAMAGATSALAAIPVYGWIALGAAALLGMGGGMVSAQTTASASKSYTSKGVATGSGDALGTSVLDSMYVSYAQQAAALGVKQANTSFSYGSNTGRQGENPNFTLSSSTGGRTFTTATDNPGLFGANEIAMSPERLKLEASRAVMTALQGSDLPKYLQGAFDGITIGALKQDEIDNWYKGAAAIKSFSDSIQVTPWENLKNMSFAAIQNLAGFAGGIENFQAKLGSFYENFYTEDVKTANLTAQTSKAFAALGATMPSADAGMRDWYRTLVESKLAMDQSIPANALVTNSVLALQEAVNTLAPAFDDAAKTIRDTLDELGRTTESLLTSLTRERESVASSQADILGTAPRDPGAIGAAVAAALPATIVGMGDVAASTQAALATAQLNQGKTAAYLSLVDAYSPASAAKAALQSQYDSVSTPDRSFVAILSTLGQFMGGTGIAGYGSQSTEQAQPLAASDLATNATYQSLFESTIPALVAAASAFIATPAGTRVYTSNGAAAAAAATAATASEAAAQAYAAALTKYVADASKATETLGKLREETMAYYEAQKKLADGFKQSASSLRAAAHDAQFGTLDTAQSLAQRAAEFSKNYSLALATSGTEKAGYADKLTGALPGLAEALKDSFSTRGEWQEAVAKLAAQSRTVADQLDAAAAVDYQGASLALLTTIDTALAAMQSDASIISAAVKSGADQSSNGLAAVVNAILGSTKAPVVAEWATSPISPTLPGFAVGTSYVPYDMTARIHEGEEITPRVYVDAQRDARNETNELLQRLLASNQALTREVAELKGHAKATSANTLTTSKTLVNVTRGGDAMQCESTSTAVVIGV